MKMSTKRVWVSFFIIVFLEDWFCEGCWKQERDALLHLKAKLRQSSMPSDWVDGTDCCRWTSVKCNNTTGQVTELSLEATLAPQDGSMWSLNMSDFRVFDALESLDLGDNNINGCVQNKDAGAGAGAGSGNVAFSLSKLKYLNLAFNHLSDSTILPCFSSMKGNKSLSWLNSNLEYLDLSSNFLSNDAISYLKNLKYLKTLDFSGNNLEGSVDISELNALTKLKIFHLNYNNISNFVFHQGNKTLLWLNNNLEYLDLSSNFLSNDAISYLKNLKYLKTLDLSENNLEGSVDISELKALTKLKIFRLNYNNISSFVVHQGTKISLTNLRFLSLEGCRMDGSMLRKSLRPFQYIKELNLGFNHFTGTIQAADFEELGNLEKLELNSSSNIKTEFFRSIGSLTSLKVLSMNYCGIKGILPIGDWHMLKKLENLDLSSNRFKGSLPTSFVNMTSLRNLYIFNNSFTGNPDLSFASLTSLESLDFEYNQFDIPASFTFLANYSSLKFFYGDGNKLIVDPNPTFQTWVPKFQLQVFHIPSTTEASFLRFPNFLVHQYNLTWVDLSDNKYEGEFPNWLMENNTNMETLILRNCTFTGHFQLPLHPLPNIKQIDISNNALTGLIPGKNISSIFPNMESLDMSRNVFHGSLPHEFGLLSSLGLLDLSHNKLDGPACTILATLNVWDEINLNNNDFSGSVESCFNTSSSVLKLSNNHFVGKLPNGVPQKFSKEIVDLYMANNNLGGSIPRKFFKQLPNLMHLDLSENNLFGSLPSFPFSLYSVQLANNKLSGSTTMMFNESCNLGLLDLSNNDITGHLPEMGNASELSVLLLKGNHFIGQIPYDLCKLTKLTVLDLSYNKLYGPIPKCVGEIPYSFSINRSTYSLGLGEPVNFTTKKRSETYHWNPLFSMSGIDLSHNELNGNIPLELGNMTFIRAVNLSHNHLTGQIPTTFSHLKQIESLDLSFNKLNGEIPPQLTELTSLEVFSLAHNNLSGRTPERKNQFITFNEDSYEGNPFLCGPPLNQSCFDADRQIFGTSVDASNIGEHGDAGFMDMQFFYTSFLVSYMSILLVMMIVLYINPHWRRTWFNFVESVIINSYYFVVDNFHKWFVNRNM